MNTHIEILIRLSVYVLTRFQAGHRLSADEKRTILSGLYKLTLHFFSGYINDDDELGTSWMEVHAHNNLCLSDKAHIEN